MTGTNEFLDGIDITRVAIVHSLMAVFRLTEHIGFPPTELAEENGLLAIGGDLSAERILAAYEQGIFPWYSEGDPLLWWFTAPRLVLFPDELNISKRLQRYYRNTKQIFTVDESFNDVIWACADSRRMVDEETWITPEMIHAYQHLHQLGYAHSVESWHDDKLVGGLYGVALGKVFFGESMFSLEPNSSKFALIYLVNFLRENGYRLIDCQMTTPHLLSLGARELDGEEFRYLLNKYITDIKPDTNWYDDGKNE